MRLENLVPTFGDVYAVKRVLVTGHTGFKGGWLCTWLAALGCRVSGLSLPPTDGPNLFSILPKGTFRHSWFGDIREPGSLRSALRASDPDIVFHLAAQSLVGASYREPLETFTTNALGTAVLLEAVRAERSRAAIVVVTSDKCYENDDTGRRFLESDALGGSDIYSMSKAAAELVVSAWHASFFAESEHLGPLATARAGNVIGGGDYGVGRIVPDIVRSILMNAPLSLRSPGATRPWQHVLDPLSGYLALGHRLLSRREKARALSFNFGPTLEDERTVRELLDAWLAAWPDSVRSQASESSYREAVRLRLDSSLAGRELGWQPVWNFQKAVAETAAWYHLRHAAGADDQRLLTLMDRQIANYTEDARRAGASWAG